MAQDPSYAVSPRSLSPQQMYQNSRHGASGLQEWDGSHGRSIQGHQSMVMAEEVPTQYRPQQPYQPYDYQAPYQTEQYAQYAAAPVTSTPSSSSSGSPQAAEDRAYPPTSLQYPQPHHYAPSNAEYISRENLITSQEVSSSSYSGQAVGHVGEWRGSGSQSQSVYSNQVTIDPPMSFPLRQVGAPASVASFDSSYTSARRSPPDSQIAFRSPSPPRIAHEPVEARHRSDSLDSRRPSVDAMTAAEQDHQSGLPSQKPKRRRADAHQLRVLNEVYARTAFPSTEERIDLGRRLGMSPRQVQIWFQNRRQNAKAGRGPPLGTPAEYQHIPIHPGPPTVYREITKAEQSEGVDPRYGQPTATYPGSRMVTKREYE
ncbi:hypothetical protein M407DRAFT_21315 [Tulasnella calospora MUT 4182]|uniref:Homeobox domain-containing protein n=1 Tax=Tulasnella calospora MUT 4182 TaxID=1051891 RepID=A0A0C3L6U2_9AGAM|nr:hypothetical protein M407DRAFT_21315 [Tulasnella calospora MUT 4182]